MKHKLLLLALTLSAALAPMSARAEDEVSFEFFYDNLSPYGDWVEVGDYGTCWRPRDVDDDWAPYTDGYWSYTDAGWTWVSYEDFGDITYHYGRWVRANEVGWCWVPDYEWGPAWVSWRKNDDYVGWAPLPPEARWRSSVGFSVWVDDQYDIGPTYYNYCPTVEFGAPVIRSVCVPRHRVIGLFGLTVNITNISYNSYNRHVFCGGPDYYYINRVCHRPVPALKLVQNTTIINNNVTIINNRRVVRGPRNTVAGNTLQVFAPKVVNKTNANIIKPQITQVVARPQIDKGWAGVKEKDPGEFRKLRDKVKTETKGLTPDTAPAKPVAVNDLKPLPPKADTSAPSPVAIAPRPGRPGRPSGVMPGETRPGKPEGVPPSTIARPSVPPGEKPPAAEGKPQPPALTTPVMPTEKPGKITTERPDRPGKPGLTTKPVPPSIMPTERPGKVTTDQPDKPAQIETKPIMPGRPPTVTDADVPKRPTVPNVPTNNPLRKPFRENNPPPSTVETKPAMPAIKKEKDRNDDAERLARQQQESAMRQQETLAAQRRMAEQQAERQRSAANADRLQKAESDARRQQMESLRPPQPKQQPKVDLSEQRERQAEAAQRQAAMQRQAESAQRQAAMQRQAEAQQRALQAQRQESLQRQMQVQRQPSRPQIERPQAQPRPQVQTMPKVQPQPRPQVQPMPKAQPQPRPQVQPMPKAQPQARPQIQAPSRGGGGLTPEQLEAMKKKNR